MTTTEMNKKLISGIVPEIVKQLESELAQHLNGLPYLFARATYANEMTLHFGAERSHTHPKLVSKVRGTHVLSLRGSAWMLRSGVQPVMVGCGVLPAGTASTNIKPYNVTALESGALIGRDAKVVRASPLLVMEPLIAFGLSLELSDGSSLMIVPTPPTGEDDGLPEPSDWELLTPENVLRVGPGQSFAIHYNDNRRQS